VRSVLKAEIAISEPMKTVQQRPVGRMCRLTAPSFRTTSMALIAAAAALDRGP
jgi:hypothetical protein